MHPLLRFWFRIFGAAALALSAGCAINSGSDAGSVPNADAINRSSLRSVRQSGALAARDGFAKIYNFEDDSDGATPQATLLNVDGTFYGTTTQGGVLNCERGCGTVYSVSVSGDHSVLHRFAADSDGSSPSGKLIDVNGTLYGTTSYGGEPSGTGTVYSITTAGKETVLYNFDGGAGGANPAAGLINVNGTLYGTTSSGGRGKCFCGTVFSLSMAGEETVLHNFSGGADGASPLSNLIDLNGTLYGTTVSGGAGCYPAGCGTIYSISTAGKEKVVHSFLGGGLDGSAPRAGLINVNGNLYGMTSAGGNAGCDYRGCGVVYRISTAGKETVLYRFAGGSDGANPVDDVIEVNGTLYGTTEAGGAYSGGTIFSMNMVGNKEVVLHNFGYHAYAFDPDAGLTILNDTLYGTTEYGGPGADGGTIFSISATAL